MIKSFFIKQMVDKLRRQKLWLFVKIEKLILNFHTHTKYSGLTTSYLPWLQTSKFFKMSQSRHSTSFHKF